MEVYDPGELEVADAIGCTLKLARELLTLAGGNVTRVIECSRRSSGLDQCKVEIVNDRFLDVEDELWHDED